MASNDDVYSSLTSVKSLPSKVLRSFFSVFSFVDFFWDSCGAAEDLNFCVFVCCFRD